MIPVEDVDLVNPAAGHEEALPWLQPRDTEPLDILHGWGEAEQRLSKKWVLGCVNFPPLLR